MNLADQSESMSAEEKFQTFGSGVRIGGKGTMTDEENEVYRRLQKILIETPGHAEYYQKRINDARERLDAAHASDPVMVGPAQHALANERMYGFQTLEQLPSVETVRVLGEFLYDDRGRPLNEEMLGKIMSSDGILLENPNSDKAAVTLGKLIATPPYPPRGYVNPGDLEVWKLWYEQVKAGNRTFRFEGDPQEYNLQGPVRVSTTAAPVGRPPRNQPPAPAAVEPPATRTPAFAAVVTALAAALALVIWRYFRYAPGRVRRPKQP
jgi:hypothetical protein